MTMDVLDSPQGPAHIMERGMGDKSKWEPVKTESGEEKTLDDYFAEMVNAIKKIRDDDLSEYICVTDVKGGGERLTRVSKPRR